MNLAVGFRCFTRTKVKTVPETMPFDNGFFSPSSIEKFLNTADLKITLENTVPCLKFERHEEDGKIGIWFKPSSYDEIDKYIADHGYDNRYLDSSKGYYTLCKEFDFVLAHYNWHPLSGKKITQPEKNIQMINDVLNRRKNRMFEFIKARSLLNIYWFDANCDFVKIDNRRYDFSKGIVMQKTFTDMFSKFHNNVKFYNLTA